MNKRWLFGGGAVVGVAAAAGAVVALAGGGSGEPVASPTADLTVLANPALTASVSPGDPALEPPVEGALPVPAFPASAVPWDEIGPGWFLAVWADSRDPAFAPVLIDPDGSVYATDMNAEGLGGFLGWVSDGLGFFRSTVSDDVEYVERPRGDVTIVDLQTGVIEQYASGIVSQGWIWETKDGTHIGITHPGDGTSATAERDGKDLGDYCWGYARTDLSPDGEHLVCLAGRTDGKTDVMLAGITGPSSESIIDVFSRGVFDYSIAGWLDADTFLLSRPAVGTYDDYIVWEGFQGWPEVPVGDGATYFAYNVSTRTIADFTLPFRGAFTGMQYDPRSQVFVAASSRGSRVDLFSRDGRAIASVDCAAVIGSSSASSNVETSGRRAVVQCGGYFSPPEHGTAAIVVVDLDDGTTTVLGPLGAEETPVADDEYSSVGIQIVPFPEPY